MKVFILLVSLALVSLLFVPAAEARGFCSDVVDGDSCPGTFCKDHDQRTKRYKTCVGEGPIIVCVRECDPPTS